MDTQVFLNSLMTPLSERSNSLLTRIWNLLDTAELGSVFPAEIEPRYDSRQFNDGCVYLGRYTDPNHAGSFRIITLLDAMDAEKRLAKCEGIGGAGEPPSFILPAWINADNSIVIDFSVPPKNGPKDFAGNWEEDGIRFVRDSNKWSMVAKSREDNLLQFLKRFDSFEDDVQ